MGGLEPRLPTRVIETCKIRWGSGGVRGGFDLGTEPSALLQRHNFMFGGVVERAGPGQLIE